MSGASGFVGSYLHRDFEQKGCKVIALGRKDFASGVDYLRERIARVNIIINLAGAPILGKWSESYKKVLYDSRIQTTRLLVDALSGMEQKPELFLSTSAIGFYKPGGPHTETQYIQDEGFLGSLTMDWEKEAVRCRELGIRTVIFRFGVVLGKDGGALGQMLAPFKLGLGGIIGSGEQAFSWIHIDDLVRVYQAVIEDTSYMGVYNMTAPKPTTNRRLTKVLGKALHRPTFLPVPEFALRLKFGEGAQVLTSGQEVLPKRLLDQGFVFLYPDIDKAIHDCVEG